VFQFLVRKWRPLSDGPVAGLVAVELVSIPRSEVAAFKLDLIRDYVVRLHVSIPRSEVAAFKRGRIARLGYGRHCFNSSFGSGGL